MLFLPILLLFGTEAAGGGGAMTPAPLSEPQILRKYSLEELDAASGFLLRASDADDSRKFCGLDGRKARALLQAIHPVIDRKSDLRIEGGGGGGGRSGGGLISRTQVRQCERECHCGIYASVLERARHLSPEDQRALRVLEEKAKDSSPSRLKECVSRAKEWFCGGPLMRYLQGSAARDY